MSRSSATLGQRIREARERANLTQMDIARHLGQSRAMVAQWESDTTSPSISKLEEVAKFLESKPQWLAYGINAEPIVIEKAPDGSVEIPEVIFGEGPADRSVLREWMVPLDYVKSELRATSPSSLIVWRVEGSNMAPAYEYGDKVIIDTNASRPSPSGTFLIWDGVGPVLHNVLVTLVDGKMIARVSSIDSSAPTYDISVEHLKIIGRVRGLIKHI